MTTEELAVPRTMVRCARIARRPLVGGARITRREFIRRSAGAAALAGLGAGGLSACGSGDDSAAQGESRGTTTIEYWHINSETFGGPTLQKLVRKFNEENPDVVVRERCKRRRVCLYTCEAIALRERGKAFG